MKSPNTGLISRAQKPATPKYQNEQAERADRVIDPQHPGRQQMTHHMTAIERRNWYQVENAEHDIDHHHLEYELAERDQKGTGIGKVEPCECPKTICCPAGEASLHNSRISTAPMATTKLLIGPTTEVRMSSSTGCLKFRGSTGVGLAQPKTGR